MLVSPHREWENMGSRARVHLALIAAVTAITATILVFANTSNHYDIATDAFQNVWERTDYPVQQGETERTWLWGPGANTPLMQEEYAEAPDGLRDVQYFDKSRMEMPWNDVDPDSPWYITQGLLARELMTGELQLGDNTFEYHAPSQRPAAGDPDGVTAPTYATMGQFIGATPRAQGTVINQAVDNAGQVSEYAELAQYGVYDGYYVDITDQHVASVFWEFMNSSGTIFENGEFAHGDVFENPFYAIGLPLTPAFWAEVKVADVKQDVLIQCFERRCLTFTPENDPAWQVESGNIGQHYYHWRYSEIDRDAIGASFTALPQARTHVPGDDRVILVTVYDDDGEPKDGVPVHAEVTWSNGYYQNHTGIEMTGTSGDDGDGQVFLSYTGQEIATDNITVTVAGVQTPKVVSTTWVRTRAEIPDDQDDDDFDPPEPVEPGDPFKIDLDHDDGDTTTAGDPHTVVAVVTDADGNPVEDGTEIEFTIDGPNSDQSGTATTENGVATFTYTGTKAGTDKITANWNDTTSDEIEVTITPGPPAKLTLSHFGIESNPPVPESIIYLNSHTILGLVEDAFENPVPDVLVDFWIEGSNDDVIGATELPTDVDNRGMSDADGFVSFSYTGMTAGEDDVFGAVVNDNDDEIAELLNKIWLDLRITASNPDGSASHTSTTHNVDVLVEYKEHEDDVWHPLPNTLVALDVSGDNEADADLSGSPYPTDQDGLVSFAYTGQSVGQDTLTVTVLASEEEATPASDDVEIDWFEWSVDLAHGPGESDTNPVNTSHGVVAELSVDGNGPVEGVELTFTVSGDANPGSEGETGGESGNTGTTTSSGTLEFRYDGGENSGTDEIEVSVTDARAGGDISPASVSKTWVDYGIHFDHQAENIYFTEDQIADITALALEHYGENWDEFGFLGQPGSEHMFHYWDLYIDEDSPNNHTVNVSATENGEKLESGEIEILVERDGSDHNPLYLNESEVISSEVATFFYAINEDIGPGVDDIQATFGQYSNDTTKTWVPLEDAEYDQLPIYVFITVEPDDPTVDDEITITVQVLDQFGQPISGHPVDISSSTQGEIPGDGSNCPEGAEFEDKHCTDEDGTIQIPHGSNNPGDEEIQVTPEGGDTFTHNIDWEYGAPFSVELSANPSEQTVNENVTLSAVVKDEPGNEIPSVSVEFATDRDGGSVLGSEQTGANGEAAEITNHTQTLAGSEEITASVNGVSDDVTITWTAGELATFLIAHDRSELEVDEPQPTESATNVVDEPHTVYALAVDAWGNPVPGAVTFIVSGENNTSGDRPISQETGIASFTYENNNKNVGQDTISASIGADNPTAADNQLTKFWVAGSGHSIVFEHGDTSGETSTNTVGDPHTVSVTVEDEFGNLATGESGTITFTVEDENESALIPNEQDQSLPDNEVELSDGTASFTYDWTATGTHTITFVHDLGVDSGNIHHESLTKVWVAGEASQIVLEHQETSSTTAVNAAGEDHFVDAIVQDEHGNTVEDFTGSVTLTNDNHANLEVDAIAGVATFSYTSLTAPRTDILGAFLTSDDSITHVQTLTKEWVAGDPHSILLSHSDDFENPDTDDKTNIIGQDTSHTVWASVTDENDNAVADGTDIQFTVTRDGSAISLPDDGVVGTTDGIASITWDEPATDATDVITVEIVNDSSVQSTPASLTKNWELPPDYAVTLQHQSESDPAENAVGTPHTFTATLTNHGEPIDFSEVGVTETDITSTFVRDTGSQTNTYKGVDDIVHTAVSNYNISITGSVATISYTGPTSPATDTISVEVEIDGEDVDASPELTKHWVAGPATNVSLVHGGVHSGHESDDPPANARYLEPHTVVASVTDNFGNTVEGDLEFSISREQGSQTAIDMWVHDPSEDPEDGASGNTGTTSNGVLAFTYTGTVSGIDEITVDLMVDDQSEDDSSVEKLWQDVRITLTPASSANNPINTSHELTALVEVEVEGDWQPRNGVDVEFAVTSDDTGHDDNYPDVYARVTGEGTNDPGETTFSFTGTNHGTDTITATITGTLISTTATKEWVEDAFAFTPEDAVNPFFTEAEIEHLLELALENPTQEDIEEFWNDLLGYDAPNTHVLDIDVSKNGGAIDDEENVSVEVLDESDVEITVSDRDEDDGTITITYTASEVGTDTITASYLGVSDSTTKTWQSLDDYDDYEAVATYAVLDIDPSTQTVGQPVTITVTVYDQFGKPVGNHPISLSSNSQGPILGPGCDSVGNAFCTDSSGQVEIDDHTSETTGTEQITALSPDIAPVAESVTWNAGAAEYILLAHSVDEFDDVDQLDDFSDFDPEDPATNIIGEDDNHTVHALVLDQYGNTVADGTRVDFTVIDDSDSSELLTGFTVVNGGDGIASFPYGGPAEDRTDVITASTGSATLYPSDGLTKIWESALPQLSIEQECDPINLQASGPNNVGHCPLAVKLVDSDGQPLVGEDVVFTITDGGSLDGSSRYALTIYQADNHQGTGSDQLIQTATTDQDGIARVTHRAQNPEEDYTVDFTAEYFDPDPPGELLASVEMSHTWADLDDPTGLSFTVEVFEEDTSWASVGSLDGDPTVEGRIARLLVTVTETDGDQDPVENVQVSFSHDANNGFGDFSDDPSDPHSSGDGDDPISGLFTDEFGQVEVVFVLFDEVDLPQDDVELTATLVDFETSISGDIRFIEFPEPDAPTNLQATPQDENEGGDTNIDLTWTAPAGPVGDYRIQWTDEDPDDAGFGGWDENNIIVLDDDVTNDTHTGRDPNTRYWYRVAAWNITGWGPWSDVADAETDVEAPTLSASEDGTDSISLTWNDVDGADHYVIEYREQGDTSWSELEDEFTYDASGYTHTGLDPSTTYEYRVGAVKTPRGPIWSNVDSATTLAEPGPVGDRLYLKSTDDETNANAAQGNYDLHPEQTPPVPATLSVETGVDGWDEVLTFRRTFSQEMEIEELLVSLNISDLYSSAQAEAQLRFRVEHRDSSDSVLDQTSWSSTYGESDTGVIVDVFGFSSPWTLSPGHQLVLVIELDSQASPPGQTADLVLAVNNEDSFVDWGGPQLQGSTYGFIGDSETVTVPMPDNIQEGDLILAVITVSEGDDIDEMRLFEGSSASGNNLIGNWTALTRAEQDLVNQGDPPEIGQWVFWIEASGNENGNYTWQFLDDDDPEKVEGVASFYHFTDVDMSDPIADYSANADEDSRPLVASSVNAPSNSLLLAFFGYREEDKNVRLVEDSSGFGSSPMTPIEANMPYNDEDEVTILHARQRIGGAGSTGNRYAYADDSADWVAHLIALRPAN
jgi:protocatechuate 3,4-dioxygenase beta subunit